MKKQITLFISLLITLSVMAQDNTHISFETSEGYTMDTINGQNTWVTAPEFSSLFTVTDDKATDGDYSLKGGLDKTGSIPEGMIAPALSPSYGISQDTILMSMDIYLAAPTGNEIDDFEIMAFGDITNQGLLITARVVFSQGNITVETSDPNNPGGFIYQLAGTFDYDNFFNFKMKILINQDVIHYYVDEDKIFTGDVFSGESLTQFGLLTNGKSEFHVDNIKINDAAELGVPTNSVDNFNYYTNEHNLYLESPETPIQKVILYNMLGQKVFEESVMESSDSMTIDLSALNEGVYIAKVELNGRFKSFKFINK